MRYFRDLVITATQINGNESFVIEIEGARVPQLMDVFQNDLRALADHLKIMDERMVLVNPKFPTASRQQADHEEQPEEAEAE